MRLRTLFHLSATFMVILAVLALSLLSSNGRAFAQNSYSDSLSACRDGYIWYSTAIMVTRNYVRVEVIGSNPSGTVGLVIEGFGPGTLSGRHYGQWFGLLNPGASVSVTAEYERPEGSGTLTLNATVGDCFGSGGPGFNPGDDRVDPKPWERVVVYCDEQFREIDVWGIGPESKGYPLRVIPFDDLTLAGPRGVRLRARDSRLGFVSASLDPQGNFYVAWDGGPFGANGQGDFTKFFRCPFEFQQIATPTPTRTPIRLPVVTLTPSPSPSPSPTVARF